MKVHVPIYRPILKQALETAWIHRELWPIAAVAGLAGTGAVINDVLNQAKLAVNIPNSRLGEVLANWPIFEAYQENFNFISLTHITLGTLIMIAITLFGVAVVAACQQVIIRVAHTALKHKRHLSLREIGREFVHPRIFRFITLILFLKLAVANLMLVTKFLVANLQFGQIVSDAFFGLVFALAVLAFTLSLNVVVIIALIGIARKNLSLGQSLAYAWNIYRRHAFICLEMSILLFAFNFLVSAAYDGTLIAVGAPAVIAFLSALKTGSLAMYIVLVALTTLLTVVITLAFAGFATTFTYAAWTGLADRLEKKTVPPRVIWHTRRFFQHLR